MRTKLFIMAAGIILAVLPVSAQQKEWTLAQCIDYVLNENLQVRKAGVTASVGEINLQQAKDNRWPNLSASAGESLGWQQITDVNDVSELKGSSRTSLSEKKPVLSLSTLKALEARLPEDRFMRVHRSFIVSLEKVKVIDRNRIVFGEVRIPVTDQYKENFQKFLNGNFI